MAVPVPKQIRYTIRTCSYCGLNQTEDQFLRSRNFLYKDGVVPICNGCIQKILVKDDFNWKTVNRLCQYFDIPFIPKEFERLRDLNGDDAFFQYVKIFNDEDFCEIHWDDYYDTFKELQSRECLEDEIPKLAERRLRKLQEKWGKYAPEDLEYLEGLHTGMKNTQNINGTLQEDQAIKLCKLSLAIDSNIREGREVDKLLSSYEKLIKIADFTAKNAKNAADFESVGELFLWLEKKGYAFSYYDNVPKDIVDETIRNSQNFLRRLYTNETDIGTEITARIEALQNVAQMEAGAYDLKQEYDIDEYDTEGFLAESDNEEFSEEVE